MERDVRGRFLPGNQVARGNRGNRQPKYGNNNAMKHGLYNRYTGLLPGRSGSLSIYKNGVYLGSLHKKYYHITEKGEIMIDVQVVQRLIDVCGLPESLFGDPEYVEYYE
ncbi:hypothetical protein MK435_08185 [Streptococcus oralis]|jgi:hypothetical protein|uniref:Uncharacterized protein n=1 Tax=Streptococcus mitis TaxID=28037 RepID=A0A428BER1_STRMT|nr:MULTISPECIES: hypothetical protein [Streptococcus]DAK12992.1 MAG TPA: hypothetical protein [Caudoviricetes sp.]MCY7110831.1 hypothetical protein [Streptococcus oralis]MDU3189714.1 hypothetical protein [Streptococcus mitis]MDU7138750.1 hypothetical protein [Streptococcus mitis]RSI61771.1 hypothetical protein D8865_03895 [Streptococcus mitis]